MLLFIQMRKYLPDWFFVLVFPLYVVAAGIVVANIFLFSNTGSIAQENGSKEIKLSFEIADRIFFVR